MIGLKLDQAKGMFFDAPKVVRAVDKATRQVLSKFSPVVLVFVGSALLWLMLFFLAVVLVLGLHTT